MENNNNPSRMHRSPILIKRLVILPVLMLAVVFAGCATPQSTPLGNRCKPITTQQTGPSKSEEDQAEKDKAKKDKGTCTYIQLTPLSSVWTGFTNPDENYSNFYTRILINSFDTREQGSTGGKGSGDGKEIPATEPLYNYRDRGAFLRTIWGTHYSLNLTAYVSVGAFQATVPLVTLDHTSNHSDGEKFVRIVAHTIQNFPLILLKGDGSNTMATVHFVVKATDTTQSSAAAAAIETATGVATVLAPESSVLTTLSSQTSKDKANALDKAINAVLSRQLDEEQWLDNDARRWGKGARVTFLIPPSTDESNWGNSAQFSEVGSWVVKFEAPRPSIFSDIQICLPPPEKPGAWCQSSVAEAVKAAQEQAASRPEQVLNFNLVNGAQSLGTVSAYLKQQSWWDSSLKTFNALKSGDSPKDAVSQFCRSIRQTIVGVGLNATDGLIVAGAVGKAAALPGPVATEIGKNSDCLPATGAHPDQSTPPAAPAK